MSSTKLNLMLCPVCLIFRKNYLWDVRQASLSTNAHSSLSLSQKLSNLISAKNSQISFYCFNTAV